MKKLSFIVFVLCLIFTSCSSSSSDNDDDASMEEGAQKLENMYKEIIELSLVNSQSCTNSGDWSFTLINSSACGSDTGFIPYYKKINTAQFLAKIKKYQDAKIAFNTKWKIVSACDIRVAPTGVECVNGKPTLTYNHVIF